LQVGSATGITEAHIEAIATITSNEKFESFYTDLKNEYAAFKKPENSQQPMKDAIHRLKTSSKYQAKHQEIMNLAYTKMSKISGRPDPADDVANIMTLIEQGQGVDPHQIGKDIAFYSGRAWLVLFVLDWKILDKIKSIVTWVISVHVRCSCVVGGW